MITHRAHIPFLSPKKDQSKASCPLCHQLRPSLTHRFWTCSYITTFWDQVLSCIFEVTLLKLPKHPLLLIFGQWDPLLLPWSQTTNLNTSGNSNGISSNKDWVLICCLIACKTILKNWTTSHCPSISQIKRELLLLLSKDRLNTDFKQVKSRARFYSKWQTFMLSTLTPGELAIFDQFSFSYYDPLLSNPVDPEPPTGKHTTSDL